MKQQTFLSKKDRFHSSRAPQTNNDYFGAPTFSSIPSSINAPLGRPS